MSNLKNKLRKLDLAHLKVNSGRTVADELKRHARLLADCILYELSEVYDSYSPKVYQRDFSLYNSVSIDNFIEVRTSANGPELSMGIYFDERAYHTGFDGKKVNTAILLSEGWQTRGSFSNVEYLGYRQPTYFIEKAIKRYKNSVDKPFKVRINFK